MQVLIIMSFHNMVFLVDICKKNSNKIRDAKCHSMNMIRDPNGANLEETLSFQNSYAKVVLCKYLETRFSNNGIVSTFKFLNPSNVPSKRVGLNS